MLKVLSISSLYPYEDMPNYGIFVANRLRAMQMSGDVDITLITPHPCSVAHRLLGRYRKTLYKGPLFEMEDCGISRYHVPVFSIPGFLKVTEFLSLRKWLLDNAKNLWVQHGPFDVIDVHWGYPDLPAAAALSELWKIPLNMTLRGMETFYQGDFREPLIQRSMEMCDGVISLSDIMLKHASSVSDLQLTQKEIVINGANPGSFFYKEQSQAREILGIETNQIMLLSIGTLVFRKGFHCVIDALADLIKDYPELHYYILGAEAYEPGFRKSLEDRAHNLGLSEHVHFRGPVLNKDLNNWYAAADWMVLSSASEGSPNVVSEALMAGCPVIATPVGAAPDILSLSPRSGHLFPSEVLNIFEHKDHSAQRVWTQTFHEILSSTPRISSRERRKLSDDMSAFTWDWCAGRTNEHLRRLVNGNTNTCNKSMGV